MSFAWFRRFVHRTKRAPAPVERTAIERLQGGDVDIVALAREAKK